MSIEVSDVTFFYSKNTPFEYKALDSVNCTFPGRCLSAVIGATGSGKTTLIQLFNGLEKPDSGIIKILGQEIGSTDCDLRELRCKAGLVFQYPEYQFFEETVELDVGYGPLMMKLPAPEIKTRVKTSLESLGLDYELFAGRSPYHLSGGEQRRVAIASILAMEPEILILDEPTAGLDFSSKHTLMNLLRSLVENTERTVVIVTHDIELLLKYADYAVFLSKGKIIDSLDSDHFLQMSQYLIKLGIDVPEILSLVEGLTNMDNSIKPAHALKALKDYSAAVRLCLNCCKRMS